MINEEELIQENIQNLGASDIPIVSYFGSGSSLLGSILIKLGMDYIEGYQEKIIPGEKKTVTVNPFWREHWQILDEKYVYADDTQCLRFFKAHHYPASFKGSAINKAILLVRDGRDAALSYYNWRTGFVNDKRTFDEFLKTDSYFKRKPLEDWSLFCEEWGAWGKDHNLHVVTFENLKFNPFPTIKKLLEFAGVDRSDEDIFSVIEETSFKNMRRQEDMNSSTDQPSRIFRKGLIGEWRDVYTVDQLDYIKPQAQEWLQEYGYSAAVPKIPAYDVTVIAGKENENYVREGLAKKVGLSTYVLNGEFHPRYLETALGKKTLNLSGHFEIIRSVDMVCQIYGLTHIIPNADKESMIAIDEFLNAL